MSAGGGESSLESRLRRALSGAYTIEREVGRGGMGVVYQARDERLKRLVAVKVLPPELAYRTDIRARFIREAETAARLSHPNIVPIHAVGDADDLVYFVMGFVDGESLGLRLKRRGRISIDEARRIMRETADALSAAHQQGVIHRDVKPDNILLEGTRGRVMVTDFGIAKALEAEGGTLTDAGVAIGTPAFMSPEQAAGERTIDGRSDLYSLGVVAYQMLTGELPFTAPTVPGLLMKQISEMPTPVDRKRPEAPKELALTVMRCLEKDPEDRWPTADALRRALETSTYSPPAPRPAKPGRALAQPGASASEDSSDAGPAPMGAERARDWVAELMPPMPGSLRRGDYLKRDRIARRLDRIDRKLDKKQREEREIEDRAKKSGEPVIVVRYRHEMARAAAVGGGLMLMNFTFAGGVSHPWSLIVVAIFGFNLARGYAKLWTSGYSWRDVIERPPAPDAVEAKGGRSALGAGSPDELGVFAAGIEQARSDRAAVISMLDRMPKSEKRLLPEVGPTVDQLLERATELGRTLSALDRDLDTGSIEKLDARIAALEQDPPSADRERRLTLLQQQRQKVGQLAARRGALASQLESCLLAMQNVRFDLLRLRSAGVADALGDLTAATQQARALSRDVDNAIVAAGEIRRITGNDANLPRD